MTSSIVVGRADLRVVSWLLAGVFAAATWALAYETALGRPALLLLAAAAAVSSALAFMPRVSLVLVAIVIASVLPTRAYPVSIGTVRSDLGELLVFGLAGAEVLRLLYERRRWPAILNPVVLLLGAVALGAVVGVLRGADRAALIAAVKSWGIYLLVPVIVSLCGRNRTRRDQAEAWFLGFTTWCSAYVLVASLLGSQFADGSPGGTVVIGQQVFSAVRLRPAVVPLLGLAILLSLRRALRDNFGGTRGLQLATLTTLLVFSFNRSTWVPLFVATIGLCVLRPGKGDHALRGLRRGLLTVLAAGLLLVAAGSGALGSTPRSAVVRLQSAVSGSAFQERSYTYRQDENAAALRALRGHQLTGIGMGIDYGLSRAKSDGIGGQDVSEQVYIHNGLLRTWLSTGAAGLLALASLGLVVARRSARAVIADPSDLGEGSRALAAGLALAALFGQGLFQTAMLNRPVILTVGVALALLNVAHEEPA